MESPSHLQNWMVRAVLLLVLFAAADLWLVRHYGFGLEDPRWLGGIGATFFVAFGLVGKLLDSVQQESVDEFVGKLKRYLLSYTTIVLLYLAAAFMAITHSSVLIIPEQAGQELQYSIVPIEGQASAAVGEQRTDESVYRIGVWTGPFGRTYQLTVNGYVPITIDVFPLFGKIVRVGQDMDKSPTLLLRPWIGALRSLRNNGTFKLWRILLKGERQLIADARGHDGSFLVGWEQVVSRNYISDWRSELIATSGSREPEVLERTILSWRNLKHIVPMSQNQKIYFKPGEKLEAEVYSRADVLVAKVSITVSNQTLQDVVIEDIERDSGSS